MFRTTIGCLALAITSPHVASAMIERDGSVSEKVFR